MSQPTTSGGVDDIIPIETKYMYVTAVGVPREKSLMKDCCTICKELLGCPCVKCTSTLDKCPVVFGVCSHAFHQHCSDPWVQQHNTCASCGAKWQQERSIQLN